MKMILNSSQILYDSPILSEKTRKYLEKFWKFSKKEDLERQKEKYYVHDYQRDWQADVAKNKEVETQSIA
jgi:hypothetical protein